MRIAREIIETLKMELGFLRYKSTSLSFESQILTIQARLQPSVNSLPLPNLSLRISSSKALRPVISEAELTNESCVGVRDFTQVHKHELLVQTLDFNVKLDSVLVSYLNLRFVDGLNFKEKETNGFVIKLLKANLKVENPIFHKNDTSFNLKIREARCRIISEELKVKPVPEAGLFYMLQRKPEEFVERDVILSALKSLKTKYDISSLKFYGYYKYIPLEYAKMMRITSGGYLTIFLDPKVGRLNLRPQRLVNIVVFRYGDKYVYHVAVAM
uniref:Uncharacterized protein n=1 Tax=Fervidobacterium thailandense TaxID=1008305 RepID=A0A7C4RVW2_9BACT